MKKYIILATILAVNLSVFGQVEKSNLKDPNSLFSAEKTVLQTNTDFVLAGEYLFYKLFTISGGNTNSLSSLSKIGYVELINSKKEVVLSHKLRLKNGVGHSDLFIPSKALTGMYKLIGYTNLSKNNANESLFTKDIFIVNPYTANTLKAENPLEKNTKLIKKEEFSTQNTTNPLLSIATQKEKFNTREALNLTILIDEKIKNGNYSVSIRKLDSVAAVNPNTQKYSAIKSANILYLPEMRGELVTGEITTIANVQDVNNKYIALSIPSKSYAFKVAKTDAKGRFFFNLNEEYNESKALFQVMESNNEDYTMTLDSIGFNDYSELQFSDLEIDPKLKNTLEQRNIHNQIENAYYEKKQDSSLNIRKNDLFYGELGVKRELDNYTRFKTVRETFIEVINEAGVRKNNDGKYSFVVYDNEVNDYLSNNLSPLVLVDGILIQNNEDLVIYESNKIKSITILSGQYIYGSKLFKGVIDVKTYLQDFKTTVKGDYFIEKQLKKPEPRKIYFQPNYSNLEQINNRIPDYRRQLLWIPEITEMNTVFKTYTSDVKGIFEIKLEGITNLGAEIKVSTFIEVN